MQQDNIEDRDGAEGGQYKRRSNEKEGIIKKEG